MNDQRTTFLLPCSCGREIPIETQQAGETIRCECGRSCAVPTMRAIKDLRPAPDAPRAAAPPAWGNSQRCLVSGLVLLVLAMLASAIVYWQFPASSFRTGSPEIARQHVEKMPLREKMFFFHNWILPGIEMPAPVKVERNRNIFHIGLGVLAGLGAIGLILAGVGVAGIARR